MTYDTNRYQPTTFAKSLRAHVEAWCHRAGSRPRAWAKWTDGIYPDYRTLAEKSVRADSVKLHEYADSHTQFTGICVQPVSALPRRH